MIKKQKYIKNKHTTHKKHIKNCVEHKNEEKMKLS